jgi:hypothetical protein
MNIIHENIVIRYEINIAGGTFLLLTLTDIDLNCEGLGINYINIGLVKENLLSTQPFLDKKYTNKNTYIHGRIRKHRAEQSKAVPLHATVALGGEEL